LFNDLEAVCFVKFPALRFIKRRLLSFGACGALMSGSGSAIYGLFSDKGRAEDTIKIMKRTFRNGEEILLCRTILV